MGERVCSVIVRLTENEKILLQKKAKLSSMKMEPFIRKLIAETEVKARPPGEYVQLVREINHIGNNINQIAHIANATRGISQEQIDMVKKLQNDIVKLMRGLS
ncbi:MAG: plasmid mobilization relaxosome protein MobC [Clostridia bacterium]|nr:plasmid mobilization relaxosome protein MobC [Clostridia bacterium]